MGATAAPVTFWASLSAEPDDAIRRVCEEAEQRRVRADYDTGSITAVEASLLRALAESLQARVVIEVGTFIGTSTHALASASSVERVYTCDASNDCLPHTDTIRTFPKQTSTQMLRTMARHGVASDLCFFDGVLNDEDVTLLARVCRPGVVFAVHDYNYGPKIRKHGLETMPRKGIGNIRLLQRTWPSHCLVEPMPETTLAALVPEGML
jgi:predicted O-methyltransferase YrrM